jgi:hypothetical protein
LGAGARFKGPKDDRREEVRFRRPAHVFYKDGPNEGRGILHDLSMCGARIEKASSPVRPGSRVELTFSLRGDLFPGAIGATVTRRTDSGFAVKFDPSDPDLETLLRPLVEDFAARGGDEEDDEDDTEPTLP